MSSHAPYGRRWWALGVLGLSLFLISLDNTILNVALPTLQEDLSPSASGLQWIVDSYLLVFAGLLLVAGSLGDRFGRRRMLFAGLGIFGLGSVLAAFSGSAELLIASRALMGVGAAAIMPSTLSILTNTFPDRERAKAIAIWSGVAGLGVAFGPVVGGYLLKHFWWGSVFLVNVPFVVIAVAAGLWLVPESRDPRVSRLDPIGAVLSVIGLTTLVWAGRRRWCSDRSRRRLLCSVRSWRGSCVSRARCCRCGSSATAASRRPASRSRSCSSRSSA
jgi:MFS family permease